ncbi:hypothetical protein Tco_0515128 [Tanacetum coccineum]
MSEDIWYAGSDTRPPMLDRTDFESWQQRIRLYCLGKDNGENIMKSITEGPFQMGTFIQTPAEDAEETEGALQLGPERARVFTDLSAKEKERYKADIRATNILLQGIPKDIYTLINHYTDAKDIWDNVKMILEGSEFSKLINDMRNIKMTMSRMQLNSKFVNNMLPEWSRFITEVKLNRGLKESNFDQFVNAIKSEYPTQSSESPQSSNQPSIVDNCQMDTGSTSTDNLIESLTNTLFLLNQSFKAHLPQTNNQLRTSSNARNNATVQDVVVQDARGRYNANNQGRPFQEEHARGNFDAFDLWMLMRLPPHRPCSTGLNLSSRDPFNDEAVHQNDSNPLFRKKAETSVPKPLSALTVYPPNTPIKLVPRVLPTKSQVKINLYIKNLEHQIQEKDNVIRDLKVLVSNVNDRSCEPYNANDVTALIEQNECVRVELEEVKQHYKELLIDTKAQLRRQFESAARSSIKTKVLAPGWHAMIKKFTSGKLNCGYQWRPTGKKFALGELCPLTRLPVTCCSKLDLEEEMAPVRISSGPEPKMMFGQNSSSLVLHQMMFGQNSSSLVLHQMMSAQISSGLAPQCLKMFEHSSSSLGLHCQKTFKQISSNLVSQMSQRRLLASLQAPFLKEKKGVRFSALYLQQKRNLLVLDHSHQQVSYFFHARSVVKWINVDQLIRKGNLLLDLQKLQKNPIFRISVDIRQNTNFRSLLHDNIVPKPDLALELGKSISLTEAEEEAVAREVHATHARIVS